MSRTSGGAKGGSGGGVSKGEAEALANERLLKTANLSDLASAATSRTNLGLGSAATHPATDFDAAGAAATETTRAEAAEALKLAKASNLSDLASSATARTNLGLGTAATQASSAFDAAGAAATAQAAAEAAKKTFRVTKSFAIKGKIAVETIPGEFEDIASGQTLKLVKVRSKITAGTKVKWKLQKRVGEAAATDITGFTGEAKTAPASVTPTAVTVNADDEIDLVIESVEGTPENLTVTLVYELEH